MSDLNDLKEYLARITEQQTELLNKVEHLTKEIEHVQHNQAVIYGRMIVTRKNMVELYSGEYPSMTENEEKEIANYDHPPLVSSQERKKQAH